MKKIISAVFAVIMTVCMFGNSAYAEITGDINADGRFDSADILDLQQWLTNLKYDLGDWQAGDMINDGVLNVFDLCLMKRMIVNAETHTITVSDTEELKSALAAAKPGDEILLAEGEYIYSGSTPKGHMFTCEADGSESSPVILRSENPEKPAVLSGTVINSNYVLTVTGDWWIVKDIKITNGSKGIIIDNSNYTKLINCEVYNIGAEGIHFRDDSSYCTADSCYIHDTGLVSLGYGEGIYVGSAKSTTGYGFKCDNNTITNCKFGPNITAEHIDIKEYTTGTVIENCTFDGIGISGENSSKSFVNIKGNDCILRNCTGYRNGCEKITRAFEANQVVDGWGQNSFVYGNKVYMDTPVNANDGKMYFFNAWNCSATVWDNYMAYDNDIFSVDTETDRKNYYNGNALTFGEP